MLGYQVLHEVVKFLEFLWTCLGRLKIFLVLERVFINVP